MDTSGRDIDYDLQIITIADNSIGVLFIIITLFYYLFSRDVRSKRNRRIVPVRFIGRYNIIRFIVIYETNSVILYYTIGIPDTYLLLHRCQTGYTDPISVKSIARCDFINPA